MPLKTIPYLLVIFSLLLVLSCNEEEKDTEKPNVNLVISQHDVVLSSTAPMRGIVDVQVTAQDKGKIKLISVYVGNNLMKEEGAVTASSFSFDTRTVEDGEHEIKSVVQDESGNVSENSLSIKIVNTLFSYTKPVVNGINNWLVFSDNAGNVIEYKSMKEGGTLKFLYPLDFKDEDFDISIITSYSIPALQGAYYIKTIKNVTPEQSVIYKDQTPSVGKYTLNTPDLNIYKSYIFDSKNLVSYDFIDESHYALGLTQATSDFYFWIEKQNREQFYYYAPSISIGDALTINNNLESQMKPMTPQRINFAAENAFTIVSGKSKDGKDLACSFTFVNEPGFLLYYPKELNGSVFKGFVSSVIYSKVVGPYLVTFSYNKETQDFLTAIEELQADIVNISKKNFPTVEMSFTGSADYIEYKLEATDPSIMQQQWMVYSKFSTTSNVKLPQFPADLLQKAGIANLSAQTLTSFSLSKVQAITSYDQVVDAFLGTPPQNFFYNSKAKSYALLKGNSGGRTSLKKWTWSAIPDKMKPNGVPNSIITPRSQFFQAQ